MRVESPWRTSDVRVLCATTAFGFCALLAAWLGTSATARVAEQIPWINVGAIGVLAIAAGNYRWMTHGRRAIGVRQHRVHEQLADLVASDPGQAQTDDRSGRPVAGAGMVRYHRPDCPVAAGKAVQAATPAAHERAGRRPCRMCSP